MRARECLEEFRVDCELRRLSPRTIKGYCNNSALFLTFLEKDFAITELEAVRPPHIKKCMQYLTAQKLTPSYINIVLKSIRAFFRYASDEGYISSNPATRIQWQKEKW